MSAALLPPSEGDQSIGYKLEAVALTTFCLAAIAVGLRVYARAKYARFGWDDFLMVLAAILAFLATVTEIVGIAHGIGRHYYFLTPLDRQQQAMYNSISQVFCIMSLCLCKISICISMLRIIRGSRGPSVITVKWILFATIAVVSMVNAAIIVTLFAQCYPVRKVWDPSIPGTCFAFPIELELAILQGAVSAFTDFLLSVLPIIIFKQLQIDKRTKIILCVLMGLGVFTGVIAIVRMSQTGLLLHSTGGDSSYGSVLPLLWAALERNVAIMAASIAAMRPLLHPFIRLSSRGLTYVRGNKTYPQSREFSHVDPKDSFSLPQFVWIERHGSEDDIIETNHF